MEVTKKKNIQIDGKHNKPILCDVFYQDDQKPKPVVIFCHGYKGFKDWGAWDKMAETFAEKGYFFVKFNFSHNGTTPENPTEFLNIEAFGDNNYTIELDDLQSVIDWILLPDFPQAVQVDVSHINLIGHSRGGAIAIIKAANEKRITRLVTFAAPTDLGSKFPTGEELEKWEKKGVQYVVNSRTKQQLPHHYQFYKNYKENKERFNVKSATQKLDVPHMIAHGSNDTTVSISSSGELFEWSPISKLLLVENANHVFEATHPWEKDELPEKFQYLLDRTFPFLEAEVQALVDEYGDSDD